MPNTTHHPRHHQRSRLSPAEIAVDDQLNAGADDLVRYLLVHCDRWALDEPPEVLDQLRQTVASPTGATPHPVGL